MLIYEGRSYDDGIDFYVIGEEDTFFISSKRLENGEIKVEKKDELSKSKRYNKWRLFAILGIVLYIILASFVTVIFYPNISDKIFSSLDILYLYLIGMSGLLMYLLYTLLYVSKNDTVLNYHGACHVVLNYYEKNKKMPETIEDLANEDVSCVTCLFNMFPCIMLFIFLCFCVVTFFHTFLSILLLFIGSFLLARKMWVDGFGIPFEKSVINYPTINELEVALSGLKMFIEENH